VNTAGANAACMDASTASSNRKGLGRHARDANDRCSQAGYGNSV
jgi:hypothetical protein